MRRYLNQSASIFVLLALASLPAFSQVHFTGFTLSEDPAALVLEYSRIPGELGNPDLTPLLRIYADGRVRLHQPSYMKSRGDYSLRLTPGELNQLLSSLLDKDLLSFERSAVQQEMTRQTARRQALATVGGGPVIVTAVMDADTTVIAIHLASVTARDGTRYQNVNKRISWYGLQFDAEKYSAVRSLQSLAAAEQQFRELSSRKGFVKLP